MSDLQRDIELVSMALGIAFDDSDPAVEAWQRLRARLTPDREREVMETIEGLLWCMKLAGWEDDYWAHRGRAAIDAMKETP